VFAVLDAPDPVTEPPVPAAAPVPVTGLGTRGLEAGYPGRGPALRGVDVTIAPGRPVALVGPSGSGKSTLASVLVRFLDPRGGRYELAGAAGTTQDATACSTDAVRRAVGLGAQDAWIFDTSLGANLRLARPDATDDELVGALRSVGLGPWFAGLRDGLATAVGPRGDRLSGGERQRVALARVRLAGFDALVLDEPTEHLPPALADALVGELLADPRPTLLVTHRLAALEAAGEILVLDGGQVVERGTHRELLDAAGIYARRWSEERVTEVAPTAAGPVRPSALPPTPPSTLPSTPPSARTTDPLRDRSLVP
jgi:ABC-type multidrug transport system fused ATPase/permease subunit